MNFEELQNSWKEQPLSVPRDTSGSRDELMGKWRRQQRTVMWRNIGTSCGFAMALSVLAWVYISFHAGRSLLFSASLLTMVLLMLVYLWVLWKGTILKKMDLSLPKEQYVSQYLAALYWRRKTITVYIWVYCAVLWLAMFFYFLDVLAGASLALRIGAPVFTAVYLIGAQLLIKKKSQHKQLAQLDELISDLKKLQDTE